MSNSYFASTSNPLYSEFIHLSRYSKWLDDKNRRETWVETVDRLIEFFVKNAPEVEAELRGEVRDAILNLEVMPSMRAMMTAGAAADRDNTCIYNCSYAAIDHPRVFDELMYILLCGTGVGFSVERKYTNKLPEVSEEFHETDTTIRVGDSKIGWASAFRELVSLLYAGKVPKWDMSKVRPAGSRLKTFGGRASGPGPLVDLFEFTVEMFKKAKGRKLTSLECHDLACKVGSIVVSGGVRRSALISLSDVDDDRMRNAKTGQWWVEHGHRALANNSATYDEVPSLTTFLKEFSALYDSKCGERGIFSRPAAKNQVVKTGRRDPNYDFGTNPCGEIILRKQQFCNLSEVVVRSQDTEESLSRKVRIATILGTVQSKLTDFQYLRKAWKKNCEEERLLGVSLTGVYDHKVLGNPDDPSLPPLLEALKAHALATNIAYAEKLGINPSMAIGTVKPAGTVSQLVDSASGLHPRFARHYVRTVRASKMDPLAQLMKDMEFPCEDDKMNDKSYVFSFPMKAPDSATLVSDITAIEHLRLWMIYQDHWCDHKPSVTIYYRDEEFLDLASFVFKNFSQISGVALLPYSDHNYVQAPYQAISEEEYNEWVAKMPTEANWDALQIYELEDSTAGSQTLACTAGNCEQVDLTT